MEIVGREQPLERARRAIEQKRPIAVVGGAGIGKTTLAQAAITGAGRRIRHGAAVDYLQSRPFLPLSRILGRPPAPGDAAAVAAEISAAIGNDVLLLDDLQWSDIDTIDVLPALARATPLVVTIRPGNDAARRVVKQIEPLGEVIDLEPLDDAAALVLVHRVLRSEENVFEVVAAGGGNPLVLGALAAARASKRVPEADTLRAVVEDCSHESRCTLARLGLHDTSVDADTAGVSDLVERRLATVTADGEVVVSADLFGELGLASLADDERVELHRRLAATSTDLGEAARHWSAAGEPDRAHETALAAADVAATPASRAQLLVLAAQTAPEGARWPVMREAVQGLLELARLDVCKELIRDLRREEPPTQSEAIDREVLCARLALDEQQFSTALEITDAALRTYTELTPLQRSSLLVLRAAARGESFDIASAITDAREAERVAADAGLPTVRARLTLAALAVLTRADSWRRDLAEVFDDAVAGGDVSTAKEAARILALARFFDGDEEGGIAACDKLRGLAHRHNNLSWDREARGIEAVNLSLTRLAAPDVVAELRALLDDPAIGSFRFSIVTLLAIAEADLGHVERADELLADTIVAADGSRSENIEPLLWAQCEVAWSAGRLDECLDLAERTLQTCSPINFGTPSAAVLRRWVAWERGEDCSASPGPMVVYPVQRGLLDEARAIDLLSTLGRERDAAARFLRAAELHDEYLRRNGLRCRWAAGEALRRAGDLQGAARILESTAASCAQHGFVPLGRRVNASLRQLGATGGATPGPSGSPPTGGLTHRECEVLALVRLGLPTAEIATRLRLKPSTVESHVRKAMKRLGANNRREAALLADDRR